MFYLSYEIVLFFQELRAERERVTLHYFSNELSQEVCPARGDASVAPDGVGEIESVDSVVVVECCH